MPYQSPVLTKRMNENYSGFSLTLKNNFHLTLITENSIILGILLDFHSVKQLHRSVCLWNDWIPAQSQQQMDLKFS